MAVLPPTEESTMAKRVVGIWTNLTPRMLVVVLARSHSYVYIVRSTHKVAATKPVRSPMTPPPKAMTTMSRVHF